MPALSAFAMFLQDNGTLASDVHSMMIAQWIMAAFCVLLILGLLGAVVAVMVVVGKVKKQVNALTKTVEAKAMPLVAQGQDIAGKVQEIIADLKPKIASVSSDVTHISSVVKNKVDEAGQTFTQVNSTVQDVNVKSKAQVARVNGMVSEALTTTEQISRSIQHGIQVPIQKIAGWVAAAKSGIETLSERIPFLHHVAPPMRPSQPGAGGPGRTGTSTGPGPVPVPGRPAPAGGAGLTTPAGGHTVRPTTTSGAGSSGGTGPSGVAGSGTVRETGTAAPGGPPFVPAPDKTKL